MFYSRLFVAVSALASIASATSNFTTCCNIDPATVDSPTRAAWCRAQQNSCPELCPDGNAAVNNCDSAALTYECSCGGGSNTPNVTDYAQTLPSLECDEWKAQCTAAHPNDLAGQTFCQSYICGAKNASLAVSGSSGSSGSAASSAVSSGGSAATGSASAVASSASSSAAAATSSAAATALKMGTEYGTAAVGMGLLALFGLAL